MQTQTANRKAQNAVLAYVHDASHGWLVVSLDNEEGFPEAEKFASPFSYINLAGSNFAGDVYLEEDIDALAFCKAYGISLEGVQDYELPEDHIVRTWKTGTADPEMLIPYLRD